MSFWGQQDGTDPDQGSGDSPERAGGRVVWVVVVGLALLLAGGYAAAYAVVGDKVPRGTTISGVDVGGLTADAAVETLRDELVRRGGSTIAVSVDDQPLGEVRPDDVGLRVDYEASVGATGAEKSWTPARLWDYASGGGDVDAVVDLDETMLDDELGRISEDLGSPPRDGRVRFGPRGVTTVDPRIGRAIDGDDARDAIVEAYLAGEDAAELTAQAVQPDIDADDVQDALDSFANPAMSAPVTLLFQKTPIRLAPARYASALSMVPEDGALVPEVDRDAITALVDGATSEAGEPVDATVRIVDGTPRVVPAKPGVSFDPAEVSRTFIDLVSAAEGKREARVKSQVEEADFSTRDARDLQIKEKVSEFTTYFPYAEYRNINIGRAAEIINGTVLKPGDTFSLNDVVGERTRANGFTEGFIISDGIFKEDLGGGVSQMATTTFNAMFFAGLKDVEHKPHSFYIDRYPVGREATVAFGAVDLRFQNDTEHGVLVEATVTPSTPSSQGVVTVRMYSTKIWDIESQTSDRYGYVAPATRTLRTPDCYPNSGYSGFQVDVARVFRKAGESAIERTEDFHTDYTASDTVICKPPAGGGRG